MSVKEVMKLNPALAALLARRDHAIRHRDPRIAQLTREMATLKRWTFGKRSDQVEGLQRTLLQESIEEDIEAIATSSRPSRQPRPSAPRGIPKRVALLKELPRIEIRHEPDYTVCGCGGGCAPKRIGEDGSEKLDFIPGGLRVERDIRGKWVCGHCETLIQAPVPPRMIDRGIRPAALIAKYVEHQPLCRQEEIFGCAGLAIPRSTMAQWVGACGVRLELLCEAMKALLLKRSVLHADETQVPMLKPGLKRTPSELFLGLRDDRVRPGADFRLRLRRGLRWRARPGVPRRQVGRSRLGRLPGPRRAVPRRRGRGGLHGARSARVPRPARAREERDRLQALELYGALYGVEREAQELALDDSGRREMRQRKAKPVAEGLRVWLDRQLTQVPDGAATAKAILYSQRRWSALTRYLDDGSLPIDKNWVENRIRPIALCRSNSLFAGSTRAGRRAAVVMSLIQSARLNGRDPYAYLRDVLERLPLTPEHRLEELLPHVWKPVGVDRVH
jgi:transposase